MRHVLNVMILDTQWWLVTPRKHQGPQETDVGGGNQAKDEWIIEEQGDVHMGRKDRKDSNNKTKGEI